MAVTIQSTELATSTPLDLCKGFAIFPGLGTIRAGISSGSTASTFLSKSLTILVLRGSFSAGYQALVGVCGPSYAIGFEVEGSATEDDMSLTVSNQSMEAGFFAGFTFGLPLNASLQYWKPDHWYTPWKGHWHTSGSVSVTPRVDLIGALIYVLLKVLGDDSALSKVNNIVPGLLGTWGFIGHSTGGFGDSGGTLTASPVLSVPVNILPYIPDVGEVDEGLSDIGVTLATGPNFGLKVPVVASLKSVTLDDDATYESPSWEEETASFSFASGSSPASDPTQIKVVVAHTPQLSFTVGWFGSVSFVKLFRLSASVNIDLLGLLGITINLGTYDNDLSNTVGQAAADCAQCGAEAAARVKVVFHEPVDAGS